MKKSQSLLLFTFNDCLSDGPRKMTGSVLKLIKK